jgi:hypothetical protein
VFAAPCFAAAASKLRRDLDGEGAVNPRQKRFIAQSLQYAGAIAAVERILTYGHTEKGLALQQSPWFLDQVRLTADLRIRHLLTTGASQVSKSLVNYLVAIDSLVHGQINIGWFYASRQSLYNQQPEQFQAMIGHWLEKLGELATIERDSVTRYTIDRATANFSSANSSSEERRGGAAEGKEQTAFQASLIFCEERSGWNSTVDITPRLLASQILSKPIRELGTPGAGLGIERSLTEAAHIFCPGVICPHCGELTYLDPKGALLRPVADPRTGQPRWFNSRGEILDFWSTDGTPGGAFVACLNCHGSISRSLVADCRLYSRQSGQSAQEWQAQLPDGEIFGGTVAIYLSPLLRWPSDPFRVVELIADGLAPLNPSIYQQNKLGHASETDAAGVTQADLDNLVSLPPHDLN